MPHSTRAVRTGPDDSATVSTPAQVTSVRGWPATCVVASSYPSGKRRSALCVLRLCTRYEHQLHAHMEVRQYPAGMTSRLPIIRTPTQDPRSGAGSGACKTRRAPLGLCARSSSSIPNRHQATGRSALAMRTTPNAGIAQPPRAEATRATTTTRTDASRFVVRVPKPAWQTTCRASTRIGTTSARAVVMALPTPAQSTSTTDCDFGESPPA